jgi:acetyl-CoA carboxylase carboxyltransferase component
MTYEIFFLSIGLIDGIIEIKQQRRVISRTIRYNYRKSFF